MRLRTGWGLRGRRIVPRWRGGGALLGLLGVGLVVTSSLAQTDPETRATPAMRSRVFEKLGRAQAAADAGTFAAAFEGLQQVADMKDLSPYEKAQLYTTWGYAHFLAADVASSVQAYTRVLEQPDLPRALEASTLYTLGQLQFQRGEARACIEHLQRWLALTPDPAPEPHLILAQAHIQLQQPRQAADALETAVAIATARDRDIPESWLALQRSVYHELGDTARLQQVLEILATRYPARSYWLHLAAVYGEQGREADRLAAYTIAYEAGYLEHGSEIVLLAQLLLNASVPRQAAMIVQKAVDAGIVASSVDNLRLLSQAWQLAHEDRRALETLEQAAARSDDGEIDARLAQSHASLGQWQASVEASRRALAKGVVNSAEVQLLLGTCLHELERWDEAQSAFEQAQSDPDTRERARRWLTYLERERARLATIADD